MIFKSSVADLETNLLQSSTNPRREKSTVQTGIVYLYCAVSKLVIRLIISGWFVSEIPTGKKNSAPRVAARMQEGGVNES
ncbi:hypothetical protein DKX38_013534 [Salix brachista]|uniref:Uncharacterized protein n=1 Tax=Salix brachista TaxID=2182728 RepID=A0A5N5LS42_9ROSI|nr:hypothetical protein DKX38_013534 [Salix brachista]